MSVAPSIEPLKAAPAAQTTGLLFERHSTPLYAFCLRRLKTREEAEDAVQQTFMKALAAVRGGFVPAAEKAWLYRIAENVCTDRLRSATYRWRHESSPEALAAVAAPSSRPEQLDGIGDALAALTEQQRRAVVLREWHGLTYREIARELELSQSAVETLLFRARRSLARKLEAFSFLPSFLPWLKGFLGGSAGAKATAAAVATIGIGALALPPAVDRLRESTEPARPSAPTPAVADRPEHRPLAGAPRAGASETASQARTRTGLPSGSEVTPPTAGQADAGRASVSEPQNPAPAAEKPVSTLPVLPDAPVPPVSLPALPEVELPAPEDLLAPVGEILDELPPLPALP